MVRFGNVLGSSGSVVPLFRRQIAAGGPITLTHPEIIRYFMTIPEAAQLVLQAAVLAEGGDVFLLDMGDPVRIKDLAEQMVRLSGLSLRDAAHPDGDIEIVCTGLRPGEKLYEELLIDAESEATAHPLIYRARERAIPPRRALAPARCPASGHRPPGCGGCFGLAGAARARVAAGWGAAGRSPGSGLCTACTEFRQVKKYPAGGLKSRESLFVVVLLDLHWSLLPLLVNLTPVLLLRCLSATVYCERLTHWNRSPVVMFCRYGASASFSES
jgi:hypothetical protein